MSDSAAGCARELLRLIPRMMQEMRVGMRGARGEGLSVPQFRTLALVDFQPGASLSDAAAHVGLGAPAMSVIVTGLIRRGLLLRRSAAGDRRRMMLDLTPEGRALLEGARSATRRQFASRLSGLSEAQIATINQATCLLSGLFPDPHPPQPRSPRV